MNKIELLLDRIDQLVRDLETATKIGVLTKELRLEYKKLKKEVDKKCKKTKK